MDMKVCLQSETPRLKGHLQNCQKPGCQFDNLTSYQLVTFQIRGKLKEVSYKRGFSI